MRFAVNVPWLLFTICRKPIPLLFAVNPYPRLPENPGNLTVSFRVYIIYIIYISLPEGESSSNIAMEKITIFNK